MTRIDTPEHSSPVNTSARALPAALGYLAWLIAAVAIRVVIAVLRLAEPGPTERTLTMHGAYDEGGHLLTALMIAVGLRAIRLPIPVWAVLLGGVVLVFRLATHSRWGAAIFDVSGDYRAVGPAE